MHDKLKEIKGEGNYLLDTSDVIFSFYGMNTASEIIADFVKLGCHYDSPGEMGKGLMGVIANVHSVDKVILNDPATVAYVDGKRVVTKAKDGDEYDPLMGLLVCATRVAGKNRVSIDAWEHVLCMLADNLATAEECRMLADVLTLTADLWDAKGVAEKMDEWAKDHVAETFDLPCEQPENHEPSNEERVEKLANDVSDLIEMAAEATSTEPMASREAVRQTICDLFERGEL
jgi:hypothetical protein